MAKIAAVIFDLGGTLLDFPDWEAESAARWGATYRLLAPADADVWGSPERFLAAMSEAEHEHWRLVDTEHWSGPPSSLVVAGFRRLCVHATEAAIISVLDAYAAAVNGWARPYPDAIPTLTRLRGLGYRIGLLSNTWWAAEWHNADLATHGLDGLLDERVYTSDLPHSKPHPTAFRAIADRLGVPSAACAMVGDRPVDDISGALAAGMYAILKTNGVAPLIPPHVIPTAIIDYLAELPALLDHIATDHR